MADKLHIRIIKEPHPLEGTYSAYIGGEYFTYGDSKEEALDNAVCFMTSAINAKEGELCYIMEECARADDLMVLIRRGQQQYREKKARAARLPA